VQTKEEKPRLKGKGSITLEALTWALVPVPAAGISHVCPSQALSAGPRAACMVMLDPLLAELHSETSHAARARARAFLRHLKCQETLLPGMAGVSVYG